MRGNDDKIFATRQDYFATRQEYSSRAEEREELGERCFRRLLGEEVAGRQCLAPHVGRRRAPIGERLEQAIDHTSFAPQHEQRALDALVGVDGVVLEIDR